MFQLWFAGLSKDTRSIIEDLQFDVNSLFSAKTGSAIDYLFKMRFMSKKIAISYPNERLTNRYLVHRLLHSEGKAPVWILVNVFSFLVVVKIILFWFISRTCDSWDFTKVDLPTFHFPNIIGILNRQFNHFMILGNWVIKTSFLYTYMCTYKSNKKHYSDTCMAKDRERK